MSKVGLSKAVEAIKIALDAPNPLRQVLDCRHACMHAESLQSFPALWDLVDCSPSDSSVHRLLQARILEWITIPSSRGSSPPRDQTHISCIGRQVLYHIATWEAP